MELFCDPEVDGIITTIGGMNSNSIIPYLDFDKIKNNPKVFCGYSDITSLHLASMNSSTREIRAYRKWSNHFRDWKSDAWKKEAREWQENDGWKVLNKGEVEAEIVVCNLNTLMSSAGTPYFPDLESRVLLIEEMYAPMSREERSLMQLRLMGVFEKNLRSHHWKT
jgi:muramoyltetrapeptide carboxypeptidase LdcA involved in peptidoglycan recycling